MKLRLAIFTSYKMATESTESAEHYKEAASKGNVEAQLKLGLCYEKGHGVEIDYKKARYWLIMAATEGNAEAMWRMGIYYFEGKGVEKNHEMAFVWFEASEQRQHIPLRH